MRTLCLNLQRDERASVAEPFLTFSPRVHFRAPGLVFVDVSTTAHLFGGESGVAHEVKRLSGEFFPQATAAIADTPAVAQVLAHSQPFYVSPPAEERQRLGELPLSSLIHLEGLMAWREVREIESIIDFFYSLGLKRIQDLQRFSLESLRERWGDTGVTLWRRLNGRDLQVISPLIPSEPLTDYLHFDFSVSLLPFLLHGLERSLKRLFARLQGRGEFAGKIVLHLYCDYSNKCHLIELKPATPNRQLDLYMKLLENKLAEIDLENPIKEVSIDVVACPEKSQQLDFWQPQVSDHEKLQSLISVFNQASLTTGFLRPESEILPEDSWSLTPEFAESELIDDAIEIDGHSFQVRPSYSREIASAPRPSRLLEEPLALDDHALQRMHFLSTQPVERLEDGWWDDSRGRDYYFALSPEGQCLWIYHDRIENQYYLHGYFD